jgi:hypothetical protein
MAYHITSVPRGCRPQIADLREFQSIAELPPADLVAYFRAHSEAASRVLGESYDKRYSPSTFIEEAEGGGYRVGWFDRTRQHVQQFTDFAEAVADYVLFSFGKGRLKC